MKKTSPNIIDRFLSALRVMGDVLRGKAPCAADAFETLYALKKDPWNYEKSDYEREKYADTLALLPDEKPETVLEAGCAEGVFTAVLAERVGHLWAVDISDTAIERARERNRGLDNITYVRTDLEDGEEIEKKLPPDFDLILCSEVLYYLDCRDRIRETGRNFLSKLRPGGYLLLAHMRRVGDEGDEEGFPVPAVGYPSMGAKSVHGVFRGFENLEVVRETSKPQYVVTLFKKVS